MAYRKQYRGKRRRRRGRGRRSLAFKMKKMISSQMEGARSYKKESRNFAIECAQNTIQWSIPTAIGTSTDISAMVQSVYSAGNIYSGIGESGHISAPYSGVEENYKVDISGYKVVSHFRNIDTHPVFLTIHEIMATNTCAYSADLANAREMIMTQLNEGWKMHKADPVSTTTSLYGDDTISATGSFADNYKLDVYSQFLHPKSSPLFRKNWKIVKTKKYKLNPGDDVFWTLRIRNRVWDPQRDQDAYAGGVGTSDVIKNYSKALLVKVSGVMGRSDAANEADVIGLLQSDVSIDTLTTAKLAPLVSAKKEKYEVTDIDDLSTKTMVAATIHTMEEDHP